MFNQFLFATEKVSWLALEKQPFSLPVNTMQHVNRTPWQWTFRLNLVEKHSTTLQSTHNLKTQTEKESRGRVHKNVSVLRTNEMWDLQSDFLLHISFMRYFSPLQRCVRLFFWAWWMMVRLFCLRLEMYCGTALSPCLFLVLSLDIWIKGYAFLWHLITTNSRAN